MGFLLVLSIPVFYLTGLITFILWVVRQFQNPNKKKNRQETLEELINELEKVVKTTPDRSIINQLKIYQEEYKKLINQPLLNDEENLSIESKPEPDKVTSTSTSILEDIESNLSPHQMIKSEKVAISTPHEVISDDINKIWQSWYSNNSINLLLYIGAFLIVASASIFVGFQWETISGSLKALLITILTLSFFGFGVWFYKLPKVSNAGVTFCTIGALLIPLTGLAWYNFVFKEIAGGLGWVWLVTSLISISSYLALAFYLKNKIYVYTLSLGTLSLNWSLINIFSLDSQFYILGAIFSSFILLFFKFFADKQNKEVKELLSQPLNYSSNILMPSALGYGIIYATGHNLLFTFETSLAAALGSLYYGIYYLYQKKLLYLIVCVILFPLSVIFYLNWKVFPGYQIAISLDIVALIYLFVLLRFIKINLKEEADLFSVLPQGISLFTYLFGTVNGYSNQVLINLSTIPAILSFLISYIRRWSENLIITFVMIAAAAYYLSQQFINLETHGYILSFIYFIFGTGSYILMNKYKLHQKLFPVLTLATIFYFGLSYFFALNFESFLIFINFALSLVFFSSVLEFRLARLLFPANIFLGLGLYQYFDVFMRLNNLHFLGLIYLLLGMAYYILLNLTKNQKLFSTYLISSIGFIILAYPFVLSNQMSLILTNYIVFSLLLHASYKFNKPEILYPANVFLAIAIHQTADYLIDVNKFQYLTGFIYLGIGLIYYYLSYAKKAINNIFVPYIASSIGFITLAYLFVISFQLPFITTNYIVFALLLF